MATYPEIYNSFPNIEKILAERLPPETFANFQSWHEKYKKTRWYENNEFDFLKSIRRFFMRTFESTCEVSSLEIGLTIFEALFQQNAADRSYILIHTAYLYEHLGRSEKADECIKMALTPSADTSVILGKIGNFYRHLSEKQFKNPVERVTLVFQALKGKANYKEIIDQQLKNIENMTYYNQLKSLTGNNAESFSSKILNSPEILSGLRDLIDRMEQLVEASQITVEASYLNEVIRKSLGDAAKEFREKRGKIELSNECGLLRIKCSEIFAISKGEDDSSNFTNFYDMASELSIAKEQGLPLHDGAEKYYENYEIYIEKAISLGEEAIKNTEPQDRNGPKFYSSLADAYRLRGNLKREKKQPSSGDYKRAVELFKSLGDAIYTNYLDRNVERLAECYFSLGDYKSAIREYEILYEKSYTKKYQAALKLGDVHDAMGDFLSAKVWYLECLKISQDPAAYDKLIHLHRKHGYYEDAIEWQKKMMELKFEQKRDLDFQYFRLATLYEEKGDIEEAIKTFRYIVTKRQPDSLISLDRLISLLMSKEDAKAYQEAINWLEKKIELSKMLVWDYCRLGDCYLSLKNDDTAFEYYEKALAIHPTALSALQRIAKWHELKEQYSKVVELVKKMIEIVGDEKSDGHYKWLGDLYWKIKDKTSAIDAFYNSLRIKPKQIEIYDRLEKITGKVSNHFLIERVSELESQYEKSPSPELATEIVNRCISIQDEQHANKAFKFLPKSVYKSESYDYYEKLARIYENLEQYDSVIKARQEINKLDSLEPYLRLRNLMAIAELISEKRLSDHYHIKSNCIKEMEGFFIENGIFDEGLAEEIDIVKEEEFQEAIYTFQYEIHYLADHYLVNGYYSKAHEYIRKLLRCSKYNLQNDKVYLQTEADVLSKMERFEEAEKSLYKILAKEGDDPIALFTLGRIYRRKRDFREAIRYFRKCYKVSDSRNRVKSADQIGGTLREWINVPTLPNEEKEKIKTQAVELYQSFLTQYPDDKLLKYGLAKAYLLEPLKNGDILKGVEILTGILKSEISAGKKDRETIKELLYLWARYGENTIKEIILGKNELSQNLTHDSHSFLLREIIEIAKYESIFANDIVDTFYKIFLTEKDKGICRAICRYSMKYAIYKFYQQNTLNEIQNSTREFLKLIFTKAVTNKLETLVYLSDFLGSERGAYKEFLDGRVYHEVKEICDIIWGELDENKPDKVSEVASQLILKIKSLMDKLDTVGFFSFAEESVNIKEEIDKRKENYRAWAGNNIELGISIQNEELRVLKSLWDKVDDFILKSLDNLRYKVSGQYSLMAEHDSRSVHFLLISKFSDSEEDWQEASVNIENKFAEICSRGLKSTFTKQTTGFIGWIAFKAVEKSPSSSFNKLLEFLESTFWSPAKSDWWEQLENLVKDEISLVLPDIQERLVSHTLVQIGKLSKKTKDLLKLFLDIPHDLKHLAKTFFPGDKEMWKRIRRAKNELRSISFFQKDFLFPDGEEKTIPLSGLISSLKREFEYPKKAKSLQKEVLIYIPSENEEVPLIDYYANSEEHIKIIFRNLFYNAYDSLMEKIDKSPVDFKPEIRISISMENGYYKILFSDNGVGPGEGDKVKESSTGIGHPIISTLVGHYRGEFKNLPSEEGATFSIKLPISQKNLGTKE